VARRAPPPPPRRRRHMGMWSKDWPPDDGEIGAFGVVHYRAVASRNVAIDAVHVDLAIRRHGNTLLAFLRSTVDFTCARGQPPGTWARHGVLRDIGIDIRVFEQAHPEHGPQNPPHRRIDQGHGDAAVFGARQDVLGIVIAADLVYARSTMAFWRSFSESFSTPRACCEASRNHTPWKPSFSRSRFVIIALEKLIRPVFTHGMK